MDLMALQIVIERIVTSLKVIGMVCYHMGLSLILIVPLRVNELVIPRLTSFRSTVAVIS